jgi:cell division protein FtsB
MKLTDIIATAFVTLVIAALLFGAGLYVGKQMDAWQVKKVQQDISYQTEKMDKMAETIKIYESEKKDKEANTGKEHVK